MFSFWWSIFVWGVWSHLSQPMHVWTVDRHDTKTVSVTQTLTPIVFANASVMWLDMLSDTVHLDLQKSNDIGTVSIDSAEMLVYEDGFRDKVMEKYQVMLGNVTIGQAHLDLLQDDVHLSPFRSIRIFPKIEWSLGNEGVPDFERVGHFKDGKWYEGRDTTQLGAGALFAWCIGVVFLIVMRRPRNHQSTVVIRRKKRIFKLGRTNVKPINGWENA